MLGSDAVTVPLARVVEARVLDSAQLIATRAPMGAPLAETRRIGSSSVGPGGKGATEEG